MAGQPIELIGLVLTRACKPVAGALLDFWQADAKGDFGNSGFRLRGHQFTDAEGRYRLRSVVPGIYPGRTRHIHVKVQPRDGRVLTTQLYFPGEAQESFDGLFRKSIAGAHRQERRMARRPVRFRGRLGLVNTSVERRAKDRVIHSV